MTVMEKQEKAKQQAHRIGYFLHLYAFRETPHLVDQIELVVKNYLLKFKSKKQALYEIEDYGLFLFNQVLDEIKQRKDYKFDLDFLESIKHAPTRGIIKAFAMSLLEHFTLSIHEHFSAALKNIMHKIQLPPLFTYSVLWHENPLYINVMCVETDKKIFSIYGESQIHLFIKDGWIKHFKDTQGLINYLTNHNLIKEKKFNVVIDS